MIRHALAALLAGATLTTAPNSPATAPLAVPLGRSILADGRIDPAEWDDASTIDAGAELRLLVKRDDRFLYVAVVRDSPLVFGINLYLAAPGAADYLDLHASAKLGERRGHAGAWPEWTWWTNVGWAANVARADSFQPLRFLPDTAKEFQIRLDRLPAGAVALSADVETAQGTTALLPQAPVRDGLHWLVLRL